MIILMVYKMVLTVVVVEANFRPELYSGFKLLIKNRAYVVSMLSDNFLRQDHLSDGTILASSVFTGGDALAEVSKQRDYIRSKAAIFGLPKLTLLEGEDCGASRDSSYFYRDTVLRLPMEPLRERLKSVDPDIMLNSISILYEEYRGTSRAGDRSRSESFTTKTASELPLVIRERDMDYQIRRMFRFRQLVELYPLTGRSIRLEAETDIPPYFRGHVWAALLGAQGDYQAEFAEVDKHSASSMDRQIDVDIPRCHQYDPLLSSPTAHAKFRRLLKAWVASHPQYVYWQVCFLYNYYIRSGTNRSRGRYV